MKTDKNEVREFWDKASCGEKLYLKGVSAQEYKAQANSRYALEPYILDFADFSEAAGKRVLEIGVGLGADHQEFAEAGAELYGIDLTERAVEHTKRRLKISGYSPNITLGDAESLAFPDEYFDIVYSWGVLHHSPNTLQAINEVKRVLKVGGIAKTMVYHTWSFVGYMLWVRYALLRGRPWLGLSYIYSHYLESPGTKAYTMEQAKELFALFSDVKIRTVLTHGDLLESAAGQRHGGPLLTLVRTIWPRSLVKRFFPNHGLFMLIEARK